MGRLEDLQYKKPSSASGISVLPSIMVFTRAQERLRTEELALAVPQRTQKSIWDYCIAAEIRSTSHEASALGAEPEPDHHDNNDSNLFEASDGVTVLADTYMKQFELSMQPDSSNIFNTTLSSGPSQQPQSDDTEEYVYDNLGDI